MQNIPYILPELAKDIYNFILNEKPLNCLELGFAYGTSSYYIAAALEEAGSGHLTCVDLLPAQEWQDPTIEQLLEQAGVKDRVTVVREHTSYIWFLKKMIPQDKTATIVLFLISDTLCSTGRDQGGPQPGNGLPTITV